MPTNFNPYQLAGSTIFGPSNYNDYPLSGSQIFGVSNASIPLGNVIPAKQTFRGYSYAPTVGIDTPATNTGGGMYDKVPPQYRPGGSMYGQLPSDGSWKNWFGTSPGAPAGTQSVAGWMPNFFSNENPPMSTSTAGYQIPSVTMPQLTMPSTQPTTPAEAQAATTVADIVNKYNQQNLGNQLNAYNPYLQSNLEQSGKNIGAGLRGELGQDIINREAEFAQARGTALGFASDSPATNAALMRLLGTDSLARQAQAEQQLTGAMARTPIAQPFDVSTQMVTPAQKLDASLKLQIAQMQTAAGLTEAQMSAAVALAGQANQMGIAKLDTLSREKIAQLEAQTGLTETQIKVAAELQNAQLQARVQESAQRNNWNIALMEQELGLTKQQIQNAYNWQNTLLQADLGMAQLGAKQAYDWGTMQYGGALELQKTAMANEAAKQRALIQQGIYPGDNTQIPPFPGYGV